jgi:hypothetical protein
MSMPPVLAVLFWIWVLVAVVVLVRRRITRRNAPLVADELVATEVADVAPVEPPREPQEASTPEPAMAASAPTPVAPPPVPPPAYEHAAAPVLDDRPSTREAPAAGIADALVGIRMPCDLVPLVFDRLATDKITLSTTGYPAEIVGRSLADEVERLGYVVRPLSEREVIATRGVTELRMMIKAPGADGRHHDHPNARDDSVVVEMALS